jgi:hypothetical protein
MQQLIIVIVTAPSVHLISRYLNFVVPRYEAIIALVERASHRIHSGFVRKEIFVAGRYTGRYKYTNFFNFILNFI